MLSSPFMGRRDLVTCFKWIEYGRHDGMSFARGVDKKTVASILDTLSSSLPCCEQPCGEVHMARTWGRHLADSPWGTEILSPMTCEEISLASNQVSEPGSRSFHRWVFRCDCSPGWRFTPSWETSSRGHPQILRDNKCLGFKSLSLGVICYMVIES